MGVKKASRNYTDFLNSIHRPGKTLLFFFLARPLVVQLVVPLRNVWHKLTLLHKTINTCHLFSGNCVMMIHLALSLCIDFHTKFFFHYILTRNINCPRTKLIVKATICRSSSIVAQFHLHHCIRNSMLSLVN